MQSKTSGRSAAFRAALCAVAVAAAAVAVVLSAKRTQGLPPGTVVASGELAGTALAEIDIAVPPGIARVSVRAERFAVRLALYAPDGELLARGQDPLGEHVPVSLTILPGDFDTVRLVISRVQKVAAKSPFEVELLSVSAVGAQAPLWLEAALTGSAANGTFVDALETSGPESATRLHVALDQYRRASAAWAGAGVRAEAALDAYRAATMHGKLGEVEASLELLAEAMALNDDPLIEAWLCASEGAALLRLGRLTEALAAYGRGLVYAEGLERPAVEASLFNGIGLAFHRQGELSKARENYLLAAALAERAGDAAQAAMTQNNIGGLHYMQGEMVEALQAFQASRESNRAIGFAPGEAAALGNVGAAQLLMGEYDEALVSFQRIQELAGPDTPPQELARNLDRRADTYAILGSLAEARRYYERALATLEGNTDIPLEAGITLALGTLEARAGNAQLARTHFGHAAELYKQVSQRRGEAQAMLGAARAALDAGLTDEAARLAETLHARVASEAQPRLTTSATQLQGLVHKASGRRDAAQEALQAALAGYREVAYLPGEIETLGALAALALDADAADKALALATEALAAIEDRRARISVADLRASFLGSQMHVHELAIEALVRMHENMPDGGFDIEALQVREQAQARVLRDQLLVGGQLENPNADPELVARWRNLQRNLSARVSKLLRDSENGTRVDPGSDDVVLQWLSELDAIEAAIGSPAPEGTGLVDPLAIARSLGPDDLVLAYWLADRRSFLWVLDRSGVAVYPLPPRARLEALADGIRRSFAAAELGGARRELAQLGRALLDPVADRLRDRHLLVVPDGGLHAVPLAALTVPGTDRPLVELAASTVLPSLAFADRRAGFKPLASIAIVADPVFAVSDSRLTGRTGGDGSRPLAVRSVNAGTPERLPFTAGEARAVAALFPDDRATVLQGFEATRATILGGAVAGRDALHFATHGEAHPTFPELSSLSLSRYDGTGRAVDNVLTAEDMARLGQGAQLVVLSACQTAVGPITRGEGYQSLSRAFLLHGSKQVVATLWQVSDASSAELMTRFYRSLQTADAVPAAALRDAQRELRENAAWRDPYFWAGFVSVGWRL
ncbi:MAG: CHAT domain-containing tetratricopeptide repeat protein [Pseudomonadota bacterium]